MDPAPIDAVIYTVNGSQINIHRGSTITGICRGVQNGSIPVGSVEVKLNLGVCEGYNMTFDSYTGLQSLSVIEVEEIPLGEWGGVNGWGLSGGGIMGGVCSSRTAVLYMYLFHTAKHMCLLRIFYVESFVMWRE